MKIYRVGGAVRDKLLNYFSDENDWLVVGATPEKMVELGYLPVGNDFPVFIKPNTGEENSVIFLSAMTSQYLSNLTQVRNMRWRAPSANQVMAMAALPFTRQRMLALKKIWCVEI